MKQAYYMMKIIQRICKRKNFDYLVGDGSTLKIENVPYMPLLITAYRPSVVCVAHYYTQHGDVMYDPEIEFLVMSPEHTYNGKEVWLPITTTMPTLVYATDAGVRAAGGYVVLATTKRNDAGYEEIEKVNLQGQADIARFAKLWARNLLHQGFEKAAKS